MTKQRRRRATRRWAAPVAVAVVALSTLATACSESDDAATDDEVTGLAAISLTPLGDAPALRLGEATDLPLVVNVWATWCVPCRKEMPAFDQVAAAHRDEVRFVGVNLGDEESAAAEFVAETGVSFDQYLDPDMSAQAALSIVGMPATVFVRADGSIASTHNGALDEAELELKLSEELGVGP